MMKRKRVAILGCGPAGLLCAWAVQQAGHEVVILSDKVKSDIPGSQHLHGPVPGLTSQYPEGTIQFIRIGTAENYALKVYGDATRETGWDNYYQVFPSWNVVSAYDRLWDHFYESITPDHITAGRMSGILSFDVCDLVISTVPAQAICARRREHKFEGSPYHIKTLPTPPADQSHEIVVYNGLLTDKWYRWSILGGICSIEQVDQFPDTGADVRTGLKAITTDCDCWPEVVRCGRWAEWRHGITMYKAYQKAAQTARELT